MSSADTLKPQDVAQVIEYLERAAAAPENASGRGALNRVITHLNQHLDRMVSPPRDDGGLLYPVVRSSQVSPDGAITFEVEPGISLRDHFAGLAMPVIYGRVETGGFERVAKTSYDLADAMLKARLA